MFRKATLRTFGLLAVSILLPACGDDSPSRRPVTQGGPQRAEPVLTTTIPPTPPPPVVGESAIVF